jgi:hypothetical protein
MSMIGEYLRLTELELRRAIKDPTWAYEYAQEVIEREDVNEPSIEDSRYYSTYKSWDILSFLLERVDFPVGVIAGEEAVVGSEDWGYGPPRYFRADRVAFAAEELGRRSFDDLIRGVDPGELARAETYSWHVDDTFEWARVYYDGLVEFFAAAARDSDAMLVWID